MLFVLQQVANFPEQHFALRRRRRARLLLGAEAIDLLHDHEDDEGDDQEVNARIDEPAVVSGRGTGLLRILERGVGAFRHGYKQVREVDAGES